MTGFYLIHGNCGIPFAEHDNRSPDTVSPWGCPKEDTVTRPDTIRRESFVKVTWFDGYGYVIDLPDGRSRMTPLLTEILEILKRDAVGLEVRWSPTAQGHRRADMKDVVR